MALERRATVHVYHPERTSVDYNEQTEKLIETMKSLQKRIEDDDVVEVKKNEHPKRINARNKPKKKKSCAKRRN